MTDKRKLWVRRRARDQVIGALTEDINGERIMKEAWEDCADHAEIAVMEDELRAMIAEIKAGTP